MESTITKISIDEIMDMEKRYRATFINSITGYKSVSLIGTKDKNGNTNLSIFNSIVHLGAHPPLIGMVVRPDSVDRHTLQNIEDTGYYTINNVKPSFVEKAHQTSARYAKEISEFDAVGLTTEFKDGFFAPYVGESSVNIGLQFKEKVPFNINNTLFVIGEIHEIYLPKHIVQEDGFVDLHAASSITNSGLDSYHVVLKGKRFPYAKP
ncbi:MAG: flavin reductase family protein [Crocinitomicaceae bacterium]|jgi:flavin reductase (DIM6/NTAB) family NADH-FMN oxidoreductase RutF